MTGSNGWKWSNERPLQAKYGNTSILQRRRTRSLIFLRQNGQNQVIFPSQQRWEPLAHLPQPTRKSWRSSEGYTNWGSTGMTNGSHRWQAFIDLFRKRYTLTGNRFQKKVARAKTRTFIFSQQYLLLFDLPQHHYLKWKKTKRTTRQNLVKITYFLRITKNRRIRLFERSY